MPTKDQRDHENDEPEGDRRAQADTGAAIDRPSAEPDVYLDVPQVDVDELVVDVEDLRARVSLSVEVLDLVRLNVGADVALGKVHLDLKGVHAQALLKVRLDRVAEIVARVLATVDRNPQILEQTLAAAERTLKPVTEGGGNAVESAGEGVEGAVRRTGEGVGEAIESVPGTAERVAGGGGDDEERESDAREGGRARKRQPKQRTASKKAAKKATKKR